MVNPKTGYYQCPRCSGNNVYESEEVIGAMGLTLNTPGAVDPTMVNQIKNKVMRCWECREVAKWIDSPETAAYKAKRDASATKLVAGVGSLGFIFLGLYIVGEGIEGTTWLAVGSFVAAGLFALVAIAPL